MNTNLLLIVLGIFKKIQQCFDQNPHYKLNSLFGGLFVDSSKGKLLPCLYV